MLFQYRKAALCQQRRFSWTASNAIRSRPPAKVYFSRHIDAEHLIELYKRVSADITGRVAIKLHTGERHGPNILPRDMLNNSPLKREGFDIVEAFRLGVAPDLPVTSTTKSFLTQPLYGEGRNPPPSEPPELALSDPFSGLNDYDTGVKPGCYSG